MPNTKTDQLDLLIRESLLAMAEFVARNKSWRGREREAVSLYAFGFLVPRFPDPTQIGIEVAVPQLSEKGRKTLVCKDLVIWQEPYGTCWDEEGKGTRIPLAILEWKTGSKDRCKRDEEWLIKYSEKWGTFTGYSVFFDLKAEDTKLLVSRAKMGALKRNWISFP